MLDHQRMQYHLESFELIDDDYTISLAVFIKRKQVKVTRPVATLHLLLFAII